MIYNSTGKLVYGKVEGWIFLLVCPDLVRYYNHVINKVFHIKANTPMFAHITVVAGKFENKLNHPRWGAYQNESISFDYSNEIKFEDNYFWLTVFCDRIKVIRKELDLSPSLKYDLHLTIGNKKF